LGLFFVQLRIAKRDDAVLGQQRRLLHHLLVQLLNHGVVNFLFDEAIEGTGALDLLKSFENGFEVVGNRLGNCGGFGTKTPKPLEYFAEISYMNNKRCINHFSL